MFGRSTASVGLLCNIRQFLQLFPLHHELLQSQHTLETLASNALLHNTASIYQWF